MLYAVTGTVASATDCYQQLIMPAAAAAVPCIAERLLVHTVVLSLTELLLRGAR